MRRRGRKFLRYGKILISRDKIRVIKGIGEIGEIGEIREIGGQWEIVANRRGSVVTYLL